MLIFLSNQIRRSRIRSVRARAGNRKDADRAARAMAVGRVPAGDGQEGATAAPGEEG